MLMVNGAIVKVSRFPSKLVSVAIYPTSVRDRCDSMSRVGVCGRANAEGKAVNFACGCFTAYSLEISDLNVVLAAKFQSNGCGYMMASADVLAEVIAGKNVIDLHSLDETDLVETIEDALGALPGDRRDCAACCISALRAVFADHRNRLIEEFQGEKALICTCFGITEDSIERYIEDSGARVVEDVTQACRAGGGCGSCVMLIQEMIDNRDPKD